MKRVYVQCQTFEQYARVIAWKEKEGQVWPSGNAVTQTKSVDYAEWEKHKSNTTLCIDNHYGMAKVESAEKKGIIISFAKFSLDHPFNDTYRSVNSQEFKLDQPKQFANFPNNNNNSKKTTMKEQIKNAMGLTKLSNEQVALTMTGKLAVQRKNGEYVRYDSENDAISIQSIFPTFKIGKFCICMPTPAASLKVGDIIVHKNDFKEVTRIEGGLKAINLNSGSENGIKREVIEGLEGFSMLPKLTSLLDGGNLSGANGMNPMMLAMMMSGDKNMDDMLPLLLMGQGGKQNAMLPLMLMSGEDIDPMMLMLMSQGQDLGAQQNGAMNPMMLMALIGNKEGGDSSMKDMLMMSMISGNNMFGTAPKADTKDAEIEALKAQIEATKVDPRDAEIEALKAQIEATNPVTE